jgi:peptidoglycan/xylan/chitin deacetylase (PgdA/CDA1 family)
MPRFSNFLRLPSKLRRRTRRSRLATLLVLLGVLVIFTTPLYFIYKPPAFLIRYFQRRWPDVLWDVPTSEKVVALTIDDGPSQYTKEILQVLIENDANATFFVIGSQAQGNRIILEELITEGNELGNHAMNDEPSRSLSDSELTEQIQRVDHVINKAYVAAKAPSPPRYFRPGSGFFSDRMRSLLKRLGYQLVLGSIYPHDPQISLWRINAKHILSMLHPGGIIICHDRRSWTVPMLREVLPEIKKRGYRIVTVTELVKQYSRVHIK